MVCPILAGLSFVPHSFEEQAHNVVIHNKAVKENALFIVIIFFSFEINLPAPTNRTFAPPPLRLYTVYSNKGTFKEFDSLIAILAFPLLLSYLIKIYKSILLPYPA